MTGALEPYPAMKDSGVEWLGEVPAHWEVRRLRNACEMRVSNVDKHSKQGETPVRLCNYVDVYKNDRIHTGMPFMQATATKEEVERFGLQPRDVLITKDSEVWNDIAVPALVQGTEDNIVSGYHLALLRSDPRNLDGEFLFRALQSPSVAYQLHVRANGVTRYGLSHSAIKSVRLPLPPLPEQAAIVRFLDRADRRIRRYIRARERLIALLEEQKQAVVHEAVTGRIDVRTGQPYPTYKPSGVEWLGEVPAHWEVRRVKQLFRRIVGGSTPSSNERRFWDGPHVWVTPADVGKSTYIHGSQRRLTQEGLDNCSAELLPIGSIVVTTRAPVGNVALARVPFCTNQGCKALTPREREIDSSFAFFLLGSLQTELRSLANGTTFTEISGNKLGGVRLPVPPLPEQAAIAAYIDRTTANIDTAIVRANREIGLLNEYRTRLIADVVTGKLDVREAAAALPEADPLAADDEAGDVPDAGDAPSFDRETRPAMAAG